MRKAYTPGLLASSAIFSKDAIDENQLWEKVRHEVQHITPLGVTWKPRPPLPPQTTSRFGTLFTLDMNTHHQDRLDYFKWMFEQSEMINQYDDFRRRKEDDEDDDEETEDGSGDEDGSEETEVTDFSDSD